MDVLSKLKCLVPPAIKFFVRRYYLLFQEWLLIQNVRLEQKDTLLKLKDKQQIRCVFFALFEEIWKVDNVYRLMDGNSRFEPIILVCPIVNYGYDNMVKRMNCCFEYFKNKGYRTLKSYNESDNSYVDVKKDINPDIIVYTNPYKGLIDDRYYITNFPDVLTIYAPYYFGEWNKYPIMYDLLFHNLLWRYYLETPLLGELSKKYSRNKGRNTVVVGYPGIEKLIERDYVSPSNIWKESEAYKKRIIWAPHHTIEEKEVCNYSCFLKYSDFMIKMARKYEDKVQFVFKPHPLLRNKLDLLWGKEKTDKYYSCWEEMPNTCLKDGDYVDLFRTSDAMIHDSGSFIAEYLYVNKPVMRTMNGRSLSEEFNPFALSCLEQYYLGYSEEEIEMFIQNVIDGVDPLKEQRTKFVNEVLMSEGSPSQNIIDDILESIDNQILYRN